MLQFLKQRAPKAAPARGRGPDERSQNRDGLFAALLLAFFLHLLLFWATPRELFPDPPERVLIPQTMEVVLEPMRLAPLRHT